MNSPKRIKVNQKPDLDFISNFSEFLGHFDLLPKVGYADLEEARGDCPSFMFWGLYLVETSQDKIEMPYSIVDNLDSEAKTFVIKDTRVVKPIIINLGPTPALFSVAELRGLKWYHAGLAKDRLQLGEVHADLMTFCSKIALVLGIKPLQCLGIQVEHRCKTDDDVYLAISIEIDKRKKKMKKEVEED